MNRDEFLTEVRTARQEFDDALSVLDERQLSRPGGWGPWTLLDLLAHVTWHEREMIGVLRSRRFSGSPWWELPLDERNRKIYEANRNRPAADVLAEARAVFSELYALLEGLSERDLNDPARFAELPPDWLPWQVIASNTFDHYAEHVADLRRAAARRI